MLLQLTLFVTFVWRERNIGVTAEGCGRYITRKAEYPPRNERKTTNMAPALRLRQFTPFFPTGITPPSTPATPLPDSDAAAAPPPTPLPTAVLASAEQDAGGDAGENFGPLLNYTIWMMTGVSFTVLMLRFYCKLSRDRRLWWDDWVLKLAWVRPVPPFPSVWVIGVKRGARKETNTRQISLVIAAVMTTVSVSYGYGRPLETIDLADLRKMTPLANVAGFFSVWAAMWSKTSFALTLARISDGWILRSIWLIIVTMTAIMGSSAVMVFFSIDKLVKIRYFMFATGEFGGSSGVGLGGDGQELTCVGQRIPGLWTSRFRYCRGRSSGI